jgi:4-aminobutyrate aminotransferase-like enzyme
MAGVHVVPFPYAYRYGWDMDQAIDYCLNELKLILKSQTAPEETAAMIIEPVLGEGGYLPAPPRFMSGLREICDGYGILLIVDEVQSGFGRTGEWFAYDHSGVHPDIIVVAKGLASGMPLSGVIAPMSLMERWTPGSHGGTYGGNAIACAAATATVRAIKAEGMLANARMRGEQLRDGLEELQGRFPVLGDVRGLGLMIGAEFTLPGGSPAADLTKAILKTCHDEKLMLLSCGTYGNTVRFIPPLIVDEGQVNQALQVFEKAIAANV